MSSCDNDLCDDVTKDAYVCDDVAKDVWVL